MSALFSVLKFSDGWSKKLHFEVVPASEQHAIIKRKQFSRVQYANEKNVSKTLVLTAGCEASIDLEVDEVKCATLKYDALTRVYKHHPGLNVKQGQHIVFKLDGQIIYEDTVAADESGVCEKQLTIHEPVIVPEHVLESPEVVPMSPRANPTNGEGFAENYGHPREDPGPTPMAPRPSSVPPVPSSPPFEAFQQPALLLYPVPVGAALYTPSNVHPQMPMPESYQAPYPPQGPAHHAFPANLWPPPPAQPGPPLLGFDFFEPQNHSLPHMHDIQQYMQFPNQVPYPH